MKLESFQGRHPPEFRRDRTRQPLVRMQHQLSHIQTFPEFRRDCRLELITEDQGTCHSKYVLGSQIQYLLFLPLLLFSTLQHLEHMTVGSLSLYIDRSSVVSGHFCCVAVRLPFMCSFRNPEVPGWIADEPDLRAMLMVCQSSFSTSPLDPFRELRTLYFIAWISVTGFDAKAEVWLSFGRAC